MVGILEEGELVPGGVLLPRLLIEIDEIRGEVGRIIDDRLRPLLQKSDVPGSEIVGLRGGKRAKLRSRVAFYLVEQHRGLLGFDELLLVHSPHSNRVKLLQRRQLRVRRACFLHIGRLLKLSNDVHELPLLLRGRHAAAGEHRSGDEERHVLVAFNL